MKTFFKYYLRAVWLIWLALVPAAYVQAQAPPGWGWVNKLGTYVPNTTSANNVAGLGRDAAGNLYLFGTYVGAPVLSGVPTTSQGDGDMFLAKYTPAGTLLWLHTLQSSGSDRAVALYVEPSGRCTLAGSYGGRTGGNLFFDNSNPSPTLPGAALLGLAATVGFYGELPFVAAVDAAGTLLWANNPSPTYGLNVSALQRDGSGNCYLSANAGPQTTLNINGQSYPAIGDYDALLIKYLPAGQVAWGRRVGATGGFTGSGSVKTDAANALYWTVSHDRALTVDGQNIASRSSALPVVRGSNTLFKISSTNRVSWAKNGILQTSIGNAQGEVLAIDSQTNTLYLQGNGYGASITDNASSANALPVATGTFASCVARCDTSGAVQWIKPVAYATTVQGGASWAAVGIVSFFPDASGFTAITNTAYAAQTVFPASNTFGISQNGLPSVSRFNYATNQCDWVRVGGVAGVYGGVAIGSNAIASVIDATGNVYVAGTFAGTAHFGTTTVQSTSSAQQEIFLAKLDQTIATTTEAATQGQVWNVYPNPAAGTVQLMGLPVTAQVRVYDAQGRLVRTLVPVGTSMDSAPRALNGLAPGLYLLLVSNTTEPYCSQRLVVQ